MRLNSMHTPVIEIFKTSVRNKRQSKTVLAELCKCFPALKINFDLDDCDKILRVEGADIEAEKIIEVLSSRALQCELLS